MMMTLLMLMISTLAMNSFLMLSPLSLGMTILFMSLILATLFAYTMSSWISFLIFLIYVSGMLVMFSYFISLTPNLPINLLSITIMHSMSFMFLASFSFIMNSYPPSMTSFSTQSSMFYLKQNNPSLIILAMILLITMIVVVKITMYAKGPMRPFKYV